MVADAAQNGASDGVIKYKDEISDERFPNHEKHEYSETSNDGRTSTVHYMKDIDTGEVSDMKFKKHSDGTVNEGEGYKALTNGEK